MKKLFVFAALAAVCSLNAAENKDYSDYLKVATDQGGGSKLWTLTSNYATPTVKKLNLEIDPSEVKAAAIEYETASYPYDPVLKHYIKTPDHEWADLVVTVNGKTVFEGNPGKYIHKPGAHRIDIDPKTLKAGDNEIRFVYKRLAKGDKRKYGYIYFCVDSSDREKARRKLPKKEQGKPHNDDIRIRLLVSF
jgi:hypothetical protein